MPNSEYYQLQDMGDYFLVKVIVNEKTEEKPSSGCGAALSGNVALSFICITYAVLKIKRKIK